jgi:hypothetical protein
VTRKEPVAKNAEALKRTDGATPQKAIVIGLSPKLAPEKEHGQRRAEASKVAELPTLSQHAPSDVRAALASCWGERGYSTPRTIGNVEATRE